MPLAIEAEWHGQGYARLAGVDEAGCGPLAGPVTAAAVVFAPGVAIPGVKDSKKISPAKREALAQAIRAEAVAYALGWASAQEVDAVNIRQATFLAMQRAVANLALAPDMVLVDGLRGLVLPPGMRVEFLAHGDTRCHAIAAASILAKTARDAHMAALHERYPLYGFDIHKGYGTARHRDALVRHGPCPQHRRTFIKNIGL
jgi:ribonuclease HII